MGKMDDYESDLLDNNHLFADLVNGVLFQGREIVHPEDLEETDSVMVHADADQTRKVIRDKAKRWKNTIIAVFAVENQSYVDYRMVTRVMLAEGMEYDRQWKKLHAGHKAKKDLQESDEILSGMSAEERFCPVVTIVVYYGSEPWNGPRCLYDQLELGDREDLIAPYVCNYRINIFDYHDFDSFGQFRTDLQCLFETLRYARDKGMLVQKIQEKEELYRNTNIEVARLINEVTHVKMPFDPKKNGEGEEVADMVHALQQIIDDETIKARKEGRKEEILSLVRDGFLSIAVAAQRLKISEAELQKLI